MSLADFTKNWELFFKKNCLNKKIKKNHIPEHLYNWKANPKEIKAVTLVLQDLYWNSGKPYLLPLLALNPARYNIDWFMRLIIPCIGTYAYESQVEIFKSIDILFDFFTKDDKIRVKEILDSCWESDFKYGKVKEGVESLRSKLNERKRFRAC